MMRLLFMDCDGVLNSGEWKSCINSPVPTIHREKILELNRIVKVTGCKLVLSSAWRYMVHDKSMSLAGFGYMLRTHGGIGLDFVGLTATDEDCPVCLCKIRERRRWGEWKKSASPELPPCPRCNHKVTRSKQVQRWLLDHVSPLDVERYCVLDDDDYDFRRDGHPFVWCDGQVGLTTKEAGAVIRVLGGTP